MTFSFPKAAWIILPQRTVAVPQSIGQCRDHLYEKKKKTFFTHLFLYVCLQRSNDENGNCSGGSMEFPTTNLYELESRVFTDHWSIPYKREESLGKCLIASTCLARHGKTTFVGDESLRFGTSTFNKMLFIRVIMWVACFCLDPCVILDIYVTYLRTECLQPIFPPCFGVG